MVLAGANTIQDVILGCSFRAADKDLNVMRLDWNTPSVPESLEGLYPPL
jgi:hypothetical protein